MRVRWLLPALAAAASVVAAPALASTDAAWAQMRAEAIGACLAAGRTALENKGRLSAVVSPFGTEAHALVRVTQVVGKRSNVYVCVMDKASRRAFFDPAPLATWRQPGS
jgi:hypothetical protein